MHCADGCWIRRGLRLVLMCSCAAVLTLPCGCQKPTMPRIYGEGRLHDINEIRVGMSPNEVERVMGKAQKVIWEEGLSGMDMGRYIWEFPEGRVYFNTEGVYKAVPYNRR